MEFKVFSNGIFDSHSYLIYDNGECAIIDCGVNPENILNFVKSNSLKVRYIILTHGHIDHIFYVAQLKENTGGRLCIHEDELELYSDSSKNGTNLFGIDTGTKMPEPEQLLKHGDKLSLGNSTITIIHTPGHSPGSISVLCENHLFSGDTLFALSVGRTDFYGGSPRKLIESVRQHLYSLDDNIKVWPGHGPSTTIGHERENNPYV
ncbi:MAG: MBL fold metallo-hydrolase [Clostridiaceae bacterium]|nr:MBL fold metallo-hydrolase [Clostridiaceae bacterium]